jgi:signal transduction histidine kinase
MPGFTAYWHDSTTLDRRVRPAAEVAALALVLVVMTLGKGCAAASAASSAPPLPWHVVILNDADPTLPAFIALDTATRAALSAPGQHPVEFFPETLDAFRFPTARIDAPLVALIATKYAGIHIDAVVVYGLASLDFAERHRRELWPDARIVFQGVPVERLRERPLLPTTTGIPLQHDLTGTVDLALALRPETRRLVVVSGSGDFDRTMTSVARVQLERYAKRLTVEYWLDASIDELRPRLAGLGRDDAVLYLTVSRDHNGRTYVPRDLVAPIAAASAAPVYSPFETYLGHGVVGGGVANLAARGKRLGELAREVLAAPPGQAIPLVAFSATGCIVDYAQLRRFGIGEHDVPQQCEVRFVPSSLWRDYRGYFIAAFAVVLAQAALILALVVQRSGRRKAEEDARHRRAELMQASRLALAGELTASIAHEINQPLGAILANAGAAEALLRRGITSSDELRAVIDDIKKSDLRASEIIRRVRALVSTREGEYHLDDLNMAVGDVVDFLAGDARRRGVAMAAKLAPGLPRLSIDRIQLQQAIVNLCVNAMDAMAEVPAGNRQLGVVTRARADGGAEVIVTDTGPGIAPERMPRLFDSFFTTKVDGTGLGLSISRSIVDAHGGALSAENRRGGGALFRIVLPATRVGAAAAADMHGNDSGAPGAAHTATTTPTAS